MKKNNDKKIVLVGGCFDILHEGHIEFLKKSKNLGDTLIVLLESDENVRVLKGENRPKNNFATRQKNLIKTGFVDIVIPHSTEISENDYRKIVNSISPDIIAITRGDPLSDKKQRQAKGVGGRLVEVIERNPKYSTTSLIGK